MTASHTVFVGYLMIASQICAHYQSISIKQNHNHAVVIDDAEFNDARFMRQKCILLEINNK